MPAEAEVVLFAIQSAVRLGAAARQAYVDSTLARELVLPLPNFNPSPTATAALMYFRQQPDPYTTGPDRQQKLLIRALKDNVPLTEQEGEELKVFHTEALLLSWRPKGAAVAGDGSHLTDVGLNALVTVRQWSRGSAPVPSTLQRLAGTFVSIGVDYFTHVPGAIDASSKSGRAIVALLRGFEDIDFATEPLGDLPQKLFIATLETLGENPTIAASDPRVQNLITATAKGLVTDINARVAQLRAGGGSDSIKEQRIHDWAELVFRSALGSAGTLVAEDPHTYLGVRNAAGADAVSTVATSVIGLILDQPQGKLDQVFSRDSLDAVVRASLQVVGRHPELFAGAKNAALPQLFAAIAADIGKFDGVLQAGALPRIAAAVLDETSKNVAVLWPATAGNPQQHLLVTAASTALDVMTRQWQNGSWNVTFGPEQLTTVAKAVVAEVASTPGWLFDAAGKQNSNLRPALEAVIGVLRARGDVRLNADTGVAIVRAALAAVASRAEFLDQPVAGSTQIAVVLDAVLGSILAPGLDSKAAWVVVKPTIIVSIVEAALAGLAKTGLTAADVQKMHAALSDQLTKLAAGKATIDSLRAALA